MNHPTYPRDQVVMDALQAEIEAHHEQQMQELRQRFAEVIQAELSHDVEHQREGHVVRVVASDGLNTRDFLS